MAFTGSIGVDGRGVAAEVPGAYDPGPADDPHALSAMLDDVLELTAQAEQLRLRLLDRWADVHAHGGLAAATGWTEDEWLGIIARLSPRETRVLTTLTRRLPALPATAQALRDGTVTVDQVVTIVEATTRLSGTQLAAVDTELAQLAAGRLTRGDDPDVRVEAARAVERRLPPGAVQRRERRQLDGARLVAQSDLDGGGWVYAELDPDGFATVCTAIDDAAGPPHPDQPRRRQRAEALVGLSRAWLGTAADTATRRARPSVTVLVDLADATDARFGELLRVRGRHAPGISARLADTLACDAPLLVRLTDGARPLAETRNGTTIPAATRRAVLARDRGCRWPGCAAPVVQCDVHHLRHRADGGGHDPDNLVVLCRRHHVRLHGTHWSARLDPRTAAFSLSRRSDGTQPRHTTYPAHRPPEVVPTR